MTRLWLKRIVLLTVLFAAIGGLAVYNQYMQVEGYESITRLANNRKQKSDSNRLFDNANFKSFTIVFEEPVFAELLTDMKAYFDLYGTYQDNTMHKVDVVYSDAAGTAFTIREVGFRTKSNTSRNLPMTLDWRGREIYHQTSFQLQFNATFDYENNSNEYAVLNKREAFNLDQLNFEYCKSFSGELDEAMVSEAFAYQLYRDAGVTISHASYGLVYFQIGETVVGFGFYTFIEPIDQNFISKHFDSDITGEYGDLYKCTDVGGVADLGPDFTAKAGVNQNAINLRYSYQLKNNTRDGSRTTHEALATLIEVANGDAFARDIGDVLDIDQFVRYLAMGFLIGNTDDYRYNNNNYYLYFSVYDGPATMIPFDLDSSLGTGKHQDPTYQYGVNYDLFAATDDLAVLVGNVLALPEYRALYLSYLASFIFDYFHFDRFEADYLTAKALYQDTLIAENHLGNQVFDLRNAAWYFDTKAAVVTAKISALNSSE